LPSDPAIDLLRELIAIDSVNPSLVPGGAGEGRIATAIAAHMQRIGLRVHLQEVAAERSNVIGVLDGRSAGRSLMFCGHMDTVGVDGMDAPFTPDIRGDRVYGRGSQDMKGGLAAMIDAARVTAERGLEKGRLIVAAVVDEEYASIGADALVREWTADAAVVTEPTDLQVAICHKGFAWIDIESESDALGPLALEVEDFPTLLIADGTSLRFYGPLLPHAATLARTFEAARHAVLTPGVPELNAGLLAALHTVGETIA